MRSITNRNLISQLAINDKFIKDDNLVNKKFNERLIIDLIQKYANPDMLGSWHCPTIHTFDRPAQKLLLSQVLSAEDYEFYTKDDLMTYCAVNEFQDSLNLLIHKFYPAFLDEMESIKDWDKYKIEMRHELPDPDDYRRDLYDIDPIDGSYRYCYE